MQRVGDRRADGGTFAGIVLGLGLCTLFLGRFGPARRLLLETARPAAVAALLVLASIGFGVLAIAAARHLFLRLAREEEDFEALSLLDALLIGFAVLGIVSGAIAWVGAATSIVIMIVTAVAAAVGTFVVWQARDEWEWRFPAPAAVLLAIPVILAMAQAVTPVNSPDELVYKLALPHAYQLFGRMLEFPLNSQSYLIMADHLASFVALILSGGGGARLLHFAIFLATLTAVYRLVRPMSARGAAAAAAVVAWTPAMMIIAGWAWNDWSALGLLIIAFDRYQRWVWTRTPSDAAAAFTALGCAASVKYTALPWLLVMAVTVIVRHRRERRTVIAAAVLTAIFGAFFYLRNAVWTGSPIAPLLLPDAPQVTNYRSGALFEGWSGLVRGLDIFDPRISDESLGILLPLAALLGLAAFRSGDRRLRDLALLGAVQIAIVITISPGSRNEVNAFVPLAIAGIVLMSLAASRAHRALRIALGCVFILALAAQLVLALFVLRSYEIGPYLTGQESAGAYLLRARPFMRPYNWIALSTPRTARILLLGENRPFYLQRQFIAGGNLDGPRMARWLATFPTADAFTAQLHRMGVTHVLLHARWYRVTGTAPGMLEKEYLLEVSPATDAMLRAFMRTRAKVVYRDADYLVFEVASASVSS